MNGVIWKSNVGEQAVLVTVHGLMDSLYVKELAKKTHRGMEGNLLRGFHTGGSCFGYETVEMDGGKRLRVKDQEAIIVRRIFEMSANSAALKTIAKTLNAEGIPSPRARVGRMAPGWCPTGIREMLYNERYIGRIVWNRTRFVKALPIGGLRGRGARANGGHTLPPSSASSRMNSGSGSKIDCDGFGKTTEVIRGIGLLSRSATSKYLFSGMLVCAEYRGRLAIITGSRKNDHPRWGCPRNYSRGTCSNSLRERNDRVEARLLEGLQEAVSQPEALEYASPNLSANSKRV